MADSGETDDRQGLSPAKRALLERRLRGGGERASGIERIPRDGPLPLSFGQERLWYLNRLYPDSTAYNVHAQCRVSGSIDAEQLRGHLEHVLRRHAVLRSAFTDEGGVPAAVVAPETSLSVALEDLTPLPRAAREAALSDASRSQGGEPFDLGQPPLARAAVLKLDVDELCILVTLHHIVADERSLDILWDELGDACRAGTEAMPAVAAPGVEYADFAAWQRRRADAGAFEADLDFWRRRLAGAPDSLPLPLRADHAGGHPLAGGSVSATLPHGVAEGLRSLARAKGVSLFVLTLAAFKVLLARYSGATDIVVGTPMSNRTRTELESIVGFFVNTVVLRTGLDDDPAFDALVDRVHASTLEALDHQELPFERLVHVLKPERGPARNPVFQVMFVLQQSPGRIMLADGVEATPRIEPTDTAKFDLTLFVNDRGAAIDTAVEFRHAAFDEATIDRLLSHWQTLLAAVVSDPDAPVSRLPLLPAHERAELIDRSLGDRVDFRHGTDIAALLAGHPVAAPSAPALVAGDEEITYGELSAQSERMAAALRARGIGPEVVVGLHLERSREMIAAVLAVLRAGGAYLPLDPRYPAARLRAMIGDARPALVITQAGGSGKLLEDSSTAQVTVEQLAAERGTPPAPVDDSALAYVLYTSGSTGRPKGVEVTRRNLVHSTAARDCHYAEKPRRFLLLSSFSFDSSLAGIFWTLAAGGTLVLPAPGDERDSARIAAHIRRQRISHLLCLPSLYRILLDHETEALGQLDTVIVAGEVCPASLVATHFERVPGVRLFNEYGPTEGTVWSTFHEACAADARGPVPIGRPVANARAIVLDAHGVPLPAGIAGELYVGGAGIARGYRNDPEATAAAFLPDPFEERKDARLYRTGDLARTRDDGALEFLGRADRQVKVRGYRIELPEIERVLEAQPDVDTAVVDIHDTAPAGDVEALVNDLGALGDARADALLDAVEALGDDDLDALLGNSEDGGEQPR